MQNDATLDVNLTRALDESKRLADAITVQWPDGTRERFTGVSGDRVVTLRRGAGQP